MNLRKVFFPHDGKAYHIKSLDGLRGVAVLIVLLAHSHHVNEVNNIFQYFGRVGVYLFYILSAFLLDTQIAYKLKNGKASFWYWLNYSLRRFLRIIPIYFLYLLGYYLFHRKFLANFITSPEDVVYSIFMLESHGVFWSIPVEFKYYIFSPFLMLIFHRLLKWEMGLIIPVGLNIYFLSMYFNFEYGLEWTSTLKSIPAFLLGSILAIFEVNNLKLKKIRVIEIITLIGLLFSNLYTTGYLFPSEIQSLFNIYIMPLFLGGIFISSKYGLLRKIMEAKFLRFLGTVSFSIYLSHMLFAFGVRKYGFEWDEINFFLYFLLTVLFSSISYLLVEYPLSKIKLRKKEIVV